MPPKYRPCCEPGCPALAKAPLSRCPEHQAQYQREHDARRQSASKRGYNAVWKRIRDRFLRDHPTCARCGKPSEVAHHVVRKREGGPDEAGNLVALCKKCHSLHHANTGESFNRGDKTHGVGAFES